MAPGQKGQDAAPSYRAFISYSHTDTAFAHWLHRKLERYPVPAEHGTEALRPIFIDRAELVAGSDLTVQVREAIARSQALVVVCSPAAAASRWVAQEIALFRELHPDLPILAALHAGEPEEAFPQALVTQGDARIEPLAADFRREGDGKRLGLIKLVAGLAGLPLDRLIQRDAQQRQKRVMAITAFALGIILVLSALLVAAVRARAEAERRREETEGMVEFMLTDLRQKLKGVGRLDIMSAVNQRAMEHYAAQRDLATLPADSLERRARLLSAMGEDDLAAGQTARAQQEFGAAYRISADLLRRSPNHPDRIFNHAQNEFWLGAVAQVRSEPQETKHRFEAYHKLAERLVAVEPGSTRSLRELMYASGSLCSLALKPPQDHDAAARHCVGSRVTSDRLVERQPGNVESWLSLANNLGWEADSLAAAGKLDLALARRERQGKVLASAQQRFAEDARLLEYSMLADLGRAQLLDRMERPGEARAAAAGAQEAGLQLVRRDPGNQEWSMRLKQARDLLGSLRGKP